MNMLYMKGGKTTRYPVYQFTKIRLSLLVLLCEVVLWYVDIINDRQ
jgi:hypothetical protein